MSKVNLPPPSSNNPQLLAEPGALLQWRLELRSGTRTRYTMDPLWRAACAEANARDFAAWGVASAANEYRQRAAEIVLESFVAEAA